MIPLHLIECAGWTAAAIAVGGVILNNHRHRSCFVLWIVSNAVTAAIHLTTDPVVVALVARDAIFAALAVAGWFQWGNAKG